MNQVGQKTAFPDHLMLNKTVEWCDWCKRGELGQRAFLSDLVHGVATPVLAWVSLFYHAGAFTIRFPFVVVRELFGAIPIKNGKFRDCFPSNTRLIDLALDVYKIVLCLLDIPLALILKVIYPKAHHYCHSHAYPWIANNDANQTQSSKETAPIRTPETTPAQDSFGKRIPPPLPPLSFRPSARNEPQLSLLDALKQNKEEREKRTKDQKPTSTEVPRQVPEASSDVKNSLVNVIESKSSFTSQRSPARTSDGEDDLPDEDWATMTPAMRARALKWQQEQEAKQKQRLADLEALEKQRLADSEGGIQTSKVDQEVAQSIPIPSTVQRAQSTSLSKGGENTLKRGLLKIRSSVADTLAPEQLQKMYQQGLAEFGDAALDSDAPDQPSSDAPKQGPLSPRGQPGSRGRGEASPRGQPGSRTRGQASPRGQPGSRAREESSPRGQPGSRTRGESSPRGQPGSRARGQASSKAREIPFNDQLTDHSTPKSPERSPKPLEEISNLSATIPLIISSMPTEEISELSATVPLITSFPPEEEISEPTSLTIITSPPQSGGRRRQKPTDVREIFFG